MKRIIFLILVFSVGLVQAQAPKKFFTRFGGYGHDIAYGVIQTLNGQYAVTGSTSSFGNGNTDVYLALVDSMGWPRWQKSYGGFNNDIGKSIIQLKDSGFVIAGYTNSFGSGGYDMYMVRTDKVGNLVWQKTFGGFDWDFGYCVKEVNNGDSLIVCGNTYSYGYGKSDGFIVKTDINGNFMWQKVYGGPEDDEFKSFTLTYNNQYAFAGTTKSMGDTKGDCWFFKTRLNGDSVFSINKSTPRKENINDIQEISDNGFILCGGADTSNGLPDRTDSYIIKFDEFGGFLWDKTYGLGLAVDDQHQSMCKSKTVTENYFYVRKTDNGPSKLDPNLMLLSPTAGYLSQTSYGGLENDELYCAEATRDKGYILCGYTISFNANLTDFYLIKTDSTIYGSNVSLVGIETIENTAINDLSIYPTITESSLGIGGANNRHITYTVFDITGKILLTDDYTESSHINVSELTAGVYFIRLTEANRSKTFKFIKAD